MHLLLTDRLTCPRCGPAFGLILMSRAMEDRRVLEGSLGCPNCRERYPVQGGWGDLRPPPRQPLRIPDGDHPEPAAEPPGSVQALAAALGLGAGAGTTLLVGSAARFAHGLASLLPEIEVAVAFDGAAAWEERPGVSRLATRGPLPFFDRVLRGATLPASEADEDLLAEAFRVVAPRHRVVVLDPDAGARGRLEIAGAREIVEGPGMLVGSA